MGRYKTEILEKSRKKVRVGDVFVTKLKDYDVYFYGKVISDNANYFDNNIYLLVYLYKTPTKEIVIPDDMDENDIMVPLITWTYGWRAGLFKTICNIPVKDTEINADYGFLDAGLGKWINSAEIDYFVKQGYDIIDGTEGRVIAIPYTDCHKNILDHKPKILRNGYMLSLATAAEAEISCYLYANPEVRERFGIADDPVDEEVKDEAEEDYIELDIDEGSVFVSFNVEHEKIIRISEKVNKIDKKAYMNGYNWEIFFKYYLKKHKPEVLKGMKTDSEAGMYTAIFRSKKKALGFVEIVRLLIDDEEKLYQIIKENGAEIQWE